MLHLHLQDIRHADIELLAARFHKRPVSFIFVIGRKLRALLEDQVTPRLTACPLCSSHWTWTPRRTDDIPPFNP